MFTIEKYQNFSEVIILKSPEELCLSYEVFLGLYGNARINYLPEERFLKIRLNHSIDNEKFGKILRYLLTQDALKDFKSFEESSYRNSAKRWKRYV
jgi:hypothetical protein